MIVIENGAKIVPERLNGRQSFWKTAPGILTGAAAVVTAVAGLVAALVNAGLLDRPVDKPPVADAAPPTQQTTGAAGTQPGNQTSGNQSPIVSGTKGDVSIEIGN